MPTVHTCRAVLACTSRTSVQNSYLYLGSMDPPIPFAAASSRALLAQNETSSHGASCHGRPLPLLSLSLSLSGALTPAIQGYLICSGFYPPLYFDSFPNNSCPHFTSTCSSCRCSFLPPSRIAFLGPKRLQVPCVNAFLIREEWDVVQFSDIVCFCCYPSLLSVKERKQERKVMSGRSGLSIFSWPCWSWF